MLCAWSDFESDSDVNPHGFDDNEWGIEYGKSRRLSSKPVPELNLNSEEMSALVLRLLVILDERTAGRHAASAHRWKEGVA